MSADVLKLLSRITLGVILLVGTASAPNVVRMTENHSDSSNESNSNGSNIEIVENHSLLNRRLEFFHGEWLQSASCGISSGLASCPRDPRLRRTFLTVSGHMRSGHLLANSLLAPMLT